MRFEEIELLINQQELNVKNVMRAIQATFHRVHFQRSDPADGYLSLPVNESFSLSVINPEILNVFSPALVRCWGA